MSNIVESLYRISGTTLNEMALGEMSMHQKSELESSHLTFNNKFSVENIKNILDKAIDDVFGEGIDDRKYSQYIIALAQIIRSDFNSDYETMILDWPNEASEELGEEEVFNTVINHYKKYDDIFKAFMNSCKDNMSNEDGKQLYLAAKKAYKILEPLRNKDFNNISSEIEW